MLKWRSQDIENDQIEETGAQEAKMKGASKVAFATPAQEAGLTKADWYVRPAMILTAFALFCGLLANAAIALWEVLDQPIEQVIVEGNTQYLDREGLVAKLASSTQQTQDSASVLSTNLANLLLLTVEEPWVNNASIKRQWPPKVSVDVQEQVPVAKWGDKGLLNHQGDIFWPQEQTGLGFLPQLAGPSTETARVMEQYHRLHQFFSGTDNMMAGLTLQARGAWTLLLHNSIEVELGREQILARLQRFLELYKGHLYKKAAQIEQVDVRYTNGVAVKWRQQEEAGATQ